MVLFVSSNELLEIVLQVPSHVLMGIPHDDAALPLSPLGEASLRRDLTAIHEILEKLGYKDDEGAATEVCFLYITIKGLLNDLYESFALVVLVPVISWTIFLLVDHVNILEMLLVSETNVRLCYINFLQFSNLLHHSDFKPYLSYLTIHSLIILSLFWCYNITMFCCKVGTELSHY